MIISVGRQTGAGGRELAHKLADRLGYTYLNKEKLLQKADELGYFEEMYEFYNEVPVNTLLQAISDNEIARASQTDVVREIYLKLLSSGDYIVMGRCANCFLRGQKDFFSVFLGADVEFKLARLLAQGYDEKSAIEYMEQSDAGRASFHHYYTGEEWGGARYYDLCINTARCGVDNAVEIIEFFLNHRL